MARSSVYRRNYYGTRRFVITKQSARGERGGWVEGGGYYRGLLFLYSEGITRITSVT